MCPGRTDGWTDGFFRLSLTGCTLRGSCNVGRCEAELDAFSWVKISLSSTLTQSLPVSHLPLPRNTWRPGVVIEAIKGKTAKERFGTLLGGKCDRFQGRNERSFTVVV